MFSSHLRFLCLIAYPQSKQSAHSSWYTYIWPLSSALSLLLWHYPQSKFTWSHINKSRSIPAVPTLLSESPKWNILVITWALVICLKYTYSCPCYNYYIYVWLYQQKSDLFVQFPKKKFWALCPRNASIKCQPSVVGSFGIITLDRINISSFVKA